MPLGEGSPQGADTLATVAAQAEALATLVQATLTPIIAPLVAEPAASRQTIEHRADRVAELERENGRQGAELERAASTIVALGGENAALKGSQSPSAWRQTPWWLWLMGRPHGGCGGAGGRAAGGVAVVCRLLRGFVCWAAAAVLLAVVRAVLGRLRRHLPR
jgi:hypothetical protein